MKTVYKYPVGEVQIPRGAKVLTANMQGDKVVLWAEVDTDEVLEHRTFHVYGTGHVIPDNACYIATVFEGVFVWHVYEVV
jgi:hypothetical protein